MRRLVLEISADDIAKFSPAGNLLEKIESLEIIYHLKLDEEGFAGICRIKVRDPTLDLKKLVGVGGLVKLELLSEKDDEHIVYIETQTRMSWFKGPEAPEVYLCPPVEFQEGKLKLTFLGNAAEVKKLLTRAVKVGQEFKILSLTDARFAPDSLLQTLTEKQRKILSAAYARGYYDVPRRINSEDLAESLNLVKSTLVEHLRKAEKRLITDIMGEVEAPSLSLSVSRK